MNINKLVSSCLANYKPGFYTCINKYISELNEGNEIFDINGKYNGITALSAAAKNDNVDFFIALIEAGADPFVKTGNCSTNGFYNLSNLYPYDIAELNYSYNVLNYLHSIGINSSGPYYSNKINWKNSLKKDICGICLDGDFDFKKVEINNCKHVFHEKCLILWSNTCERLGNARTCPLCREKFFGRLKRR